MHHTNDQWRQKLTPQQYDVLRQKGTETPFSGSLLYNDKTGVYACAACQNQLFDSATKYHDAGGWPSFYDAKPGAVTFAPDHSHGMERVEVMCAACGGHLGHIFTDGPAEHGGQHYCINSVALTFKEKA